MHDLSFSNLKFIRHNCRHQYLYHGNNSPNDPGLWFIITPSHQGNFLYFQLPTSNLYIPCTYYSLYALPIFLCILKINANLINPVVQLGQIS